MLDILLARMDTETKKKNLQEEHNLPMTIKLEKEMNDMCNLSAGIREDGFREGELTTQKNMLKADLIKIEKLKEYGLYSPEILTTLTLNT